MKGFDKLAESIAKMEPNSVLLICVEKCRNPSFNVCAAGCNFNKDMEVCDYCKADQPIDVYETDIDSLALADGYVKLEPGQCVVQVEDVKELLHLWISHGPRFAEINRVMRAFAGAVALVECPICQGSGVIRVPHPMKPHVPDYIDNCDNCKGTGFVSAALEREVK